MRLAGKVIMVTGGAGFIGSHLVDRLVLEEPRGIVVVDNLFLGKEDNLAEAFRAFPKLQLHRVDACDYSEMSTIARRERVDVLFNLAVVPLPTSLERPRWTVETNIALTTLACELAREGLVRTIVHFSSSEAYGTAQYVPMDEAHPLQPSTPYAASKIACDHIVLSYYLSFGIDMAILRPFNNYGPRQNAGTYAGIVPIVLNRMLAGLPIEIFGDGEQTRDFVYVRDTAEAAVALYREERARGKVVNVASGHEVTVNELVGLIVEAAGAEPTPVLHVAPRPGDVRRFCGSAELSRSLLGFSPSYSLLDGFKETVAWYKSRLLCC